MYNEVAKLPEALSNGEEWYEVDTRSNGCLRSNNTCVCIPIKEWKEGNKGIVAFIRDEDFVSMPAGKRKIGSEINMT